MQSVSGIDGRYQIKFEKISTTYEKAKRKLLKKLYKKCTKPQQDLFCRMYTSLEKVPTDKLDQAIGQCRRTVEKNKKK